MSDMPELLARVQDPSMRDYMREALACWNAGAFRGCIVMSYAAVFDHLRARLTELAAVNGKAKKISDDIEKRAEEQDVFETEMINRLRSTAFITQPDYDLLVTIRDRRHKAAHPSGVIASA